MENKLELRDGDVLRLKPAIVFATFLDGSFQIEGSDGFFKPDMVESIITRAETPQETIARLEAELAKAYRQIKWNGGKCPIFSDMKVVVWFRDDNIKPQLSTAGSFDWNHQDRQTDITWYMVLPR